MIKGAEPVLKLTCNGPSCTNEIVLIVADQNDTEEVKQSLEANGWMHRGFRKSNGERELSTYCSRGCLAELVDRLLPEPKL